jgi:hypothetical protein
MGQIVKPEGEGHITFNTNTGTGSLSAPCLHTSAMQSIIFSSAVNCHSLDYDQYRLTYNRRSKTSQVCFTKAGAPSIQLGCIYIGRMPFISLTQVTVTSLAPIIPRTVVPIFQGARRPEILAEDIDQAVRQVLHLCHLAQHGPVPLANV